MSYDEVYRRSIMDPLGFWEKEADSINWIRRWDNVLDASNPPFYRWFSGGKLNTCYNAVDRHVIDGNGARTALIHDNPVTKEKKLYSYIMLRDEVARLAGGLLAQGIEKGDRIVIYMPMVAEAVMSMLACARIGALHLVVFGGFSAPQLARLIEDAQPKIIVTASCGFSSDRVLPYMPIVEEALAISRWKVSSCLVLQRNAHRAPLKSGRDFDWVDTVENARPAACEPVNATDPLYILYTSGTTGKQKGVVRDNGGHAVALRWSMENILGLRPGEVFFAASDIGWVVGHSYCVYGALLRGCTSILFEGKPVGMPDASSYWRIIEEYSVNVMFATPAAFRAIRKEDPNAALARKYDLTSLRALFIGGERVDASIMSWLDLQLHIPVIDHWWQTETGWPVAANCLGLGQVPLKPGSVTKQVPGWVLSVLDSAGNQAKRGQIGQLGLRLPLPPGSIITLWNADDCFERTYLSEYPGYYNTGDVGYVDEDDYVFVVERTDGVIKVGGQRVSTGALEEVLATHEDVVECAVIGIRDTIKGQVPIGFLVLNPSTAKSPAAICTEAVELVRRQIGPTTGFQSAFVVKALPRTRSGKVSRALIRDIAEARNSGALFEGEDPEVIEDFTNSLSLQGYFHSKWSTATNNGKV